MLLKNNVETVIQIIGYEKGNFITDRTGREIPKSEYNHFVILHTSPEITAKWTAAMQEKDEFSLINKISKRKSTKRKKSEVVNTFELEENDEMAENEIQREDMLGIDEKEISLDEIDGLIHIAKSRKINIPSTSILSDNNWYICPIYSGVDGLYPIIHKKLDNKKGYRLFESSVPLIQLNSDIFREDNFKEWNCHSSFILERYLEKNNIPEITVASIFVQKRESKSITMVREVLRNYELAQKSKIRCGNLLVSMLLFNLGQNAYVSTKENISKIKSEDGNVNEKDANESNMLDEILKCYDKLEEKLKEIKENSINHENTYKRITQAVMAGDNEKVNMIIEKYLEKIEKYKSARIKTEKTFVNVLDLVNQDEEKEAIQIAEEYIIKKKASRPNITLEEALKETKIFRTKDYIPNYHMYELITMYKYYQYIENKAMKILKDIIENTWLYEWTSGIKGIGPVMTAYILSYIDFHSTNHSSSVLRYLGLDQVPVKPEHTPNQVITTEEQIKIVRFLFKSYQNIISRSKLTEAMPLTEDNFDMYYKTDVITNWNKFQLIKNQYNKLDVTLDEENFDDTVEELLEDNENLNKLVNYIWTNMNIIDIPIGLGKTTQVVEKRARRKDKDRPCSTYLDDKGNIKFKTGLGYNTKVKSKLLYIGFDVMQKQSNEYYIKTIYANYVKRYTQRFIIQGKDIEIPQNKARIKSMARRATIQIFIKDLWIHARRYFGLPLNGEGYNDSKIQGCNHIHNRGIEDPDDYIQDNDEE